MLDKRQFNEMCYLREKLAYAPDQMTSYELMQVMKYNNAFINAAPAPRPGEPIKTGDKWLDEKILPNNLK